MNMKFDAMIYERSQRSDCSQKPWSALDKLEHEHRVPDIHVALLNPVF